MSTGAPDKHPQCPTCKKTFTSNAYLQQHLKWKERCKLAWDAAKISTSRTKNKKRALSPSLSSTDSSLEALLRINNAEIVPHDVNNSTNNAENLGKSGENMGQLATDSVDIPKIIYNQYPGPNIMGKTKKSIVATSLMDDIDREDVGHLDNNDNEDMPVVDVMRLALDDFRNYCSYGCQNYTNLPPNSTAGIRLMEVLYKKRAPLRLYNDIFTWHCNHQDATKVKSRGKLMEQLNERYNMEEKKPFKIKLTLPFSEARIQLVAHDAEAMIVSLLTDPDITPEDYLFHNNDPLAPPPPDFKTIGDINTGRAYRETWNQLIQPEPTVIDSNGVMRHKVLLPTPFYMDGAVTGQFQNLPLEQVKLTLGIFKGKVRDRGHAWRVLGYVKNFLPADTYAEDMLVESGHKDFQNYLSVDTLDEAMSSDEEEVVVTEAEESDDEIPASFMDVDLPVAGQSRNTANSRRARGAAAEVDLEELLEEKHQEEQNEDVVEPAIEDEKQVFSSNAQDLHCMLEAILESYKNIQERGGIDWVLPWKGRVINVRFIPYVPFIKGDTQEHDKHCGSFTSRTKNVKQLCRYCFCPNSRTDQAYEDYFRKSEEKIKALCDRGGAEEVEILRMMSQQCIDNAWYKIGFALHHHRTGCGLRQTLGVHGACPVEALHWIQLGKYKYVLGMFFQQIGPKSAMADMMDAMAKLMGTLFKRQSYRGFPRTNFSARGLRKGKLMGHEMSGVMLVLVAVLRSSKGRNLLQNSKGKPKKNLGESHQVKDWILMLETLLTFEAWLEKDEMDVATLQRLRLKVREMMELEKNVGKREKGMAFLTFNFHVILHVVDDILDHGVPQHVNTRSDEMHHKTSKTASMQTQKIPDEFDWQTANRLHEYDLIRLALAELMQETAGDKQMWEYFVLAGVNVANSAEEMAESAKNIAKTLQHSGPVTVDPDLSEEESSDEEDISVDDVEVVGVLPPANQVVTKLTGVRVEYSFAGTEQHQSTYKVHSRMKNKHRFKFEKELDDFLLECLRSMSGSIFERKLDIYTEHVRDGNMFRGSPYYRGKAWLDWVEINFGESFGLLPCQMWCFLDLRAYKPPDYGPVLVPEPGIYAVIEYATPVLDAAEVAMSEIFVPFRKIFQPNGKRDFFLVNCDSFADPCCVIPDIGSKNKKAYFVVKQRTTEWAGMFEDWVNEPHTHGIFQLN